MVIPTIFTPEMDLACANQFLEDIPGWTCQGVQGFYTPESLNDKFQDGLLWKRAIEVRGFGDTSSYDGNLRATSNNNSFWIYNIVSESAVQFVQNRFAANRIANPNRRHVFNIAASSMSLYNGMTRQMPRRREQHKDLHLWALENLELDDRYVQ